MSFCEVSWGSLTAIQVKPMFKASWSLLQPKLEMKKNQKNGSIQDNIGIRNPCLLLSCHGCYCSEGRGGPPTSWPCPFTPPSFREQYHVAKRAKEMSNEIFYIQMISCYVTNRVQESWNVSIWWDQNRLTGSVAITQNSKKSFLKEGSGLGSELLTPS